MSDPSGGGNVTVVDPGSEDDPFTAGNAPVVETPEDQPATETPAPLSQPTDDPDKPEPDKDEGQDLLKLEEYIQTRVSAAHSGLDKRINTLAKQNSSLENTLAETLKASKDAERRARAEGATDEEKAVLERHYELEDKEELLNARTKVVDEYRMHVTALDLVTRFGKYGVTAETLADAETPEDMEVLAERTSREFLESGKKPGETAGPAGAKAPSDLGGAPAAPAPFKLGTEQGVEGMAANVKNLFGQPGNIK